jgi:hypothetical protein
LSCFHRTDQRGMIHLDKRLKSFRRTTPPLARPPIRLDHGVQVCNYWRRIVPTEAAANVWTTVEVRVVKKPPVELPEIWDAFARHSSGYPRPTTNRKLETDALTIKTSVYEHVLRSGFIRSTNTHNNPRVLKIRSNSR